LSSLLIGLTACSDGESVTDTNFQPPLVLRTFPLDSGGVLRVRLTISNPTRVHLQVANSPQCPFAVHLYPDSVQQFEIPALDAFCYNARTTDVAPGDSLVLSRLLSPTDLSQYAPGRYIIEATVALDNFNTASVIDGAVNLPLSSQP
jgi:hypothetical protein